MSRMHDIKWAMREFIKQQWRAARNWDVDDVLKWLFLVTMVFPFFAYLLWAVITETGK